MPLDSLVNHSTPSGPAAIKSGSLIRGASKNVSAPDVMIRPIDPGSLPLVNQSVGSRDDPHQVMAAAIDIDRHPSFDHRRGGGRLGKP
jgi:hypothetical protein